MSSNPEWLVELIRATGEKNTGTMVDFDNFDYSESRIWGGERRYNRYEGVKMLMPFAKSVSAKSYAFDDQGFETRIDFEKMAGIVREARYTGYASVEYEGDKLTEHEGIWATKRLLERF